VQCLDVTLRRRARCSGPDRGACNHMPHERVMALGGLPIAAGLLALRSDAKTGEPPPTFGAKEKGGHGGHFSRDPHTRNDPGDLGRNCLGPHRTDWLKRPPAQPKQKPRRGRRGSQQKACLRGGWGHEGRPAFLKRRAAELVARAQGQRRLGSRYRSGRSPDWLKFKNPEAPAVKREAEEEWGQ